MTEPEARRRPIDRISAAAFEISMGIGGTAKTFGGGGMSIFISAGDWHLIVRPRVRHAARQQGLYARLRAAQCDPSQAAHAGVDGSCV